MIKKGVLLIFFVLVFSSLGYAPIVSHPAGNIRAGVFGANVTPGGDYSFNGSVGIGTGSPLAKLHVNGSMLVDNINGGTPITSANIGGQSVSYATSSGSASSVGWGSITGIPAGFSDGVDNVNDADSSATNEIQTIGTSGNSITLSSGGSITAPYATSASNLLSSGDYVWDASTTAQNLPYGITNSFVRSTEGFPNYGTLINARSYSGGGGGGLQLYAPYGSTYGGTAIKYRLADYTANPTDPSWTSWKTVIDSANIGSQSVNYANAAGNSYACNIDGTCEVNAVSGTSASFSGNVVASTPTAASHLATKGYVDGQVSSNSGNCQFLGSAENYETTEISNSYCKSRGSCKLIVSCYTLEEVLKLWGLVI